MTSLPLSIGAVATIFVFADGKFLKAAFNPKNAETVAKALGAVLLITSSAFKLCEMAVKKFKGPVSNHKGTSE